MEKRINIDLSKDEEALVLFRFLSRSQQEQLTLKINPKNVWHIQALLESEHQPFEEYPRILEQARRETTFDKI
jgi:hypothetical protein